MSMLERNQIFISNKNAKIKKKQKQKLQREIQHCSFEPKLSDFNPEKLSIVPLQLQDPETECKMSSSLERILNKNKPRSYSQMHSEKMKQRTIDNELLQLTAANYNSERQKFLSKNHKLLFMRPQDGKVKQQLNFYNTSPTLDNSLSTARHTFNGVENQNVMNTEVSRHMNALTTKASPTMQKVAKGKNKTKITVLKKKSKVTVATTRKTNFKTGVIKLKKGKKKTTARVGRQKAQVHAFKINSFRPISKLSSDKPKKRLTEINSVGRSNSGRTHNQDLVPVGLNSNVLDSKSYIFVGQAAYTHKYKRNLAPKRVEQNKAGTFRNYSQQSR